MIIRNLNNWVKGDRDREDVRRTIVDLGAQVDSLRSELAALKATSNGNAPLNARQLSQIAGLIGARSQAVFGQDVTDPVLPGQIGGGTVTSVGATGPASFFSWTGTPVTGSGTLTAALSTQAANLIFAGPASGAAAVPAFRSLVAADLSFIDAALLSSTALDLNTSTKQALYTVPTAKSALPLWVIGRSPSVDLSAGTTTLLSFGFNAAADDWSTGIFGTPALTSASLFQMMSQTEALSGSPSVIGTAAQVFGCKTDAAFGSAATLIVDVFGYLF